MPKVNNNKNNPFTILLYTREKAKVDVLTAVQGYFGF